MSYPTPGEWKGQPPHRYLETYNLYQVTRIDKKSIGKHIYYTVSGLLFNKAGTGTHNTRPNPDGHEYYQSRNAVREFEQEITRDVAYLDGPFVGPAKQAPFHFSDTDTRLCIALTNAEQERLESSRAKRMPVIGPVEKAQQRATKRQRTGYGSVREEVVPHAQYSRYSNLRITRTRELGPYKAFPKSTSLVRKNSNPLCRAQHVRKPPIQNQKKRDEY